MKKRVQITVVGSSESVERFDRLAEEVGRLIAEAGAILVCGGRDGVMEAASRGASQVGGEVLAILPDAEKSRASEHASIVVATGAGYTRNLAVVGSGDATIAIGGAWGTLSEIGYARSLGKSVIALESWQIESPGPVPGGLGIVVADSPADAIEKALAAAEAAHLPATNS